MLQRIPFRIWRYPAALALTTAAIGVWAFIWRTRFPDGAAAVDAPYVLFYASVILSAWFCGLGPGLLSAGLSALWVYRVHDSYVDGAHDVIRVSLLFGLAVLISTLDGLRRRAIRERDDFIAREHAARTAAEAEQRRSAFLAQASATLASSLDYEATLSGVAKLVVPYLADWCMVDIVEQGGELRRLAVAHANPKLAETSVHVEDRPLNNHQPSNVIRTGQREFVPEVTEAFLTSIAPDERTLKLLKAMGIRSYISTPLVARGRTLGAITFAMAESNRVYTHDDLRLAEDLARRAAVAVDNARLYHDAQQANRIKDEFLATVSHELRTPLNAVLGWVQLLRGGDLDEASVEQAVETIERNAKAQARIVEDVLDVSRIITGKLRLRTRATDLTAVIDAAADAVRPAARAKDIDLVLDVARDIDGIEGDPDRLQQVVWNLLSNAIKFTPSGGRVSLTAKREQRTIAIRVTDTGQGIAQQFLPHVFERFRQYDSSTTRSHGGLGLGLAIVRHLVELHGGTVRAESAGLGHGATFTVELPAPRPRVPALVPHPEISAPGAAKPFAPTLDGLRVLVVDDERDTLELLRTTLSHLGASVTTACTAREAIAHLERLHLDVVISDIGMPDEDGYSMIRRIRSATAHRSAKIPAVALTAYASTADRAKALSAGYQVHVAKPVEPSELGQIIAQVAGRSLHSLKAPTLSLAPTVVENATGPG